MWDLHCGFFDLKIKQVHLFSGAHGILSVDHCPPFLAVGSYHRDWPHMMSWTCLIFGHRLYLGAVIDESLDITCLLQVDMPNCGMRVARGKLSTSLKDTMDIVSFKGFYFSSISWFPLLVFSRALN